MATTYEKGKNALDHLSSDISTGQLIQSDATESDTRAKIIDRILVDVLGWEERQIDRERHSEPGFLDYAIRCPHDTLVIEAKRTGLHFKLPFERARRTYSVSSLRGYPDHVGDAIDQVRNYADAEGIEYACVTNGSQWIVFRAISPREKWVKGQAVVFRSLEDISENFVEFWNLLSADAIAGQSLLNTLAGSARDRPSFARALDGLSYSDNHLQRNSLSSQLQPLIQGLFRDLTDADYDEILRRCYVIDRKVEGVSGEVEALFNDTLPEFARRAGFQDLVETSNRSGALDDDYRRAVERGNFGRTVLLLGGVGSGKTTFIHRFFRVTAREFVDQHCLWFYVPFTEAPLSADGFGTFVRERILRQLAQQYSIVDIETLPVLRAIYAEPLRKLHAGVWAELDNKERTCREADFFEARSAEPTHCDAVLKHLRASGKSITVVLDNVDQREPADQVRIFLLAQSLCRDFDAIAFVALREESFFQAEQAGAFNAYHNTRYHIASPDVRALLRKRVEYALEVSEKGTEALRYRLRSGMEFNAQEIRSFMSILNEGALKANPAIAQFIDAIAQGNMRSALDMFGQFMVSGSTNVEKMLDIFRRQGIYHVAEHEVIKAVMLGDFQFYREARSRIANVYEVSSASAASNLTAPRLLHFLRHRSGQSHPEGSGFVRVEEVIDCFGEIFGDTEDVRLQLQRMIGSRLIETDNRQVNTLTGARLLRITKCGSYYFSMLMRRFQYLDHVALDTPCADRKVVQDLTALASSTDMYDRVRRVEIFLRYLKGEDDRSLAPAPRKLARKVFGDNISVKIADSAHADIKRVARNAKLSPKRLDQIRNDIWK